MKCRYDGLINVIDQLIVMGIIPTMGKAA